MTIPEPLSTDYRIATSREIRSWSYGAVTAARDPQASFQDHIPGTLHDQRIFGPIHDFQCACGKFTGERYAGMICDRCGVKIAPATIRNSRFGHIDFPEPIGHPFADGAESECFPVLPILFVQSPGGTVLLTLYDQLIKAANQSAKERIEEILAAIFGHLTPVVITLHDWQIPAARILARGLALEHTQGQKTSPFCAQCGYVVAGLDAAVCPGCGSSLV